MAYPEEKDKKTGIVKTAAASANTGLYPYNQKPKDIYAGLGKPADSPENTPRGTTGKPVASAAPVASQPSQNGPISLYLDDRGQEMKSQFGTGQYAQGIGTAVRTAGQGLGMMAIGAADKVVSPWVEAVKGFGRGVAGIDAPSAVTSTQPTAAVKAAAVQAAKPAPQAVANPFADATTAPAQATPAPAPATSAPAIDPTAPMNNVTRVGNSYSGNNIAGDITINGQAPRNGGFISQQNQAAPDALQPLYPAEATRGFQQSAPAVNIGPNTGGFGILDKGYQERRAAGMPLNSVTASKARKAEAAQQLDRIDQRDMRAADNASTITRQGMADETSLRGQIMSNDTSRRGQDVAAAGNQAINAVAQYRAGLEGQRLAMDQTAQGFKTRAEARTEAKYAEYEAAPAEAKLALAEQLRVMTGKEKPAEWKAIALQGGTDAMGNKTEGVLAAVNERTGESKRFDGAPPASPLPSGLVVGAPTKQADGSYLVGNKTVTIKAGKVTEIK